MTWHSRCAVFIIALAALSIPTHSSHGRMGTGAVQPDRSELEPEQTSDCVPLWFPRATAAEISNTVAGLRQVYVEDEFSGIVHQSACPLLTTLKLQLRDFVLDRLNSTSIELVGPSGFGRDVLAELAEGGIRVESPVPSDDTNGYPYGRILGLQIDQPQTGLMAMTATISINCSEDSVFYLFKEVAGRWRLLLADEADSYE